MVIAEAAYLIDRQLGAKAEASLYASITDGQLEVADDAVRLEQGVDIAGGAAGVIGQGHRGPAEYVNVGYHAALGQPVAEPPEDLLDPRAVKDRADIAHAASIS